MHISNKDLLLLSNLNIYLETIDKDIAKAFNKDLNALVEKLEIQRISRNVVNTKRIMEKRKLDKNYARSSNEIKLPLF
ncbi:MAG: hypothetical protein IKN65_00250 [Clostridia bacterium]|nr:hypothetical protein [Bacilli bacterium]MBR3672714.1 hypothetical protein [Clostridia bacterium]MBR4671588.1 hypothetical protein [Bacilli bacterium]